MGLAGCCCERRSCLHVIGFVIIVLHKALLIYTAAVLGLVDRLFGESELQPDPHTATLLCAGRLVAAVVVCELVVAFLAERGAASQRPDLLLPWLVFQGFWLVVGSLGAAVQLVASVWAGWYPALFGSAAVLLLLLYPLHWYWYAAIFSHYSSLRSQYAPISPRGHSLACRAQKQAQ